jgi:hypothetical protein
MKEQQDSELTEEDQEQEAELEAAADASAQQADEETKGKKNINEILPYVINLSKEYDFDGKKIQQVDLSGLEDLTTRDAEYIDHVMSKLQYHPTDKFRDTTYTKHIAMRVTGLPVEFFNSLRWKDQQAITARITLYFLF